MRASILLLVAAFAAGVAADDKDEAEAIAEEMRSNDVGVRLGAFDKAAALATPEALDLVAQAYSKDPLGKVVAKAAWAIARIHVAQEEKGSEDDPKWKAAWGKVADLLGKGLLKHREELDVALATIRAMAEMGDPQFVKTLSEDLWKVRERQVIHGRILALGCIRDKTSIDALMDILYVAGREQLEPFALTLAAALKRLTGQTFRDRVEAKKWWKENRGKFAFEKVDPKRRELERRAFEKMWEKAEEGK